MSRRPRRRARDLTIRDAIDPPPPPHSCVTGRVRPRFPRRFRRRIPEDPSRDNKQPPPSLPLPLANVFSVSFGFFPLRAAGLVVDKVRIEVRRSMSGERGRAGRQDKKRRGVN